MLVHLSLILSLLFTMNAYCGKTKKTPNKKMNLTDLTRKIWENPELATSKEFISTTRSRRIYDVVNVLEGAGVHKFKHTKRKSNDRGLKTASKKIIDFMNSQNESRFDLDQIKIHCKLERRRVCEIFQIFKGVDLVKKIGQIRYLYIGDLGKFSSDESSSDKSSSDKSSSDESSSDESSSDESSSDESSSDESSSDESSSDEPGSKSSPANHQQPSYTSLLNTPFPLEGNKGEKTP